MARRYLTLPWNEWYKLAKEYYLQHQNLLIPACYETRQGYKLGRWIERQRVLYHTNSRLLTSERKMKLKVIDMVWSIEKRYSWEFWINLCQKHKEQFQTINVNKNYRYEDISLGEWLFQQRKKARENTLEENRKQDLQRLGIVFGTRKRRSWDEWYHVVESYYQKNGHLNISVHTLDEKDNKIGVWLYIQKEKYRNKRKPGLSNEQILSLNKLNIQW